MSQTTRAYDHDELLTCTIAFSGWHAAASSHLREHHSSTLMQYWVLLILQTHGAMSIRAMQRMLDVNYTTVAECVSTVESRGWAVKRPSEEDMRQLIVEITAQGSAEFETLDKSMYDFSLAAWKDVPASQRKRALRLFSGSCELMSKSRITQGFIRGDSAFLVSCVQFVIDLQRACSEIPVPSSQAKLLMLLSRNEDGMRGKDIAHALSERPYEVSKALTKMESKRLVVRMTGESGREKIARLTELGRKKASAVECEVQGIVERRFGWIEDNALFFDVLERLAAALTQR